MFYIKRRLKMPQNPTLRQNFRRTKEWMAKPMLPSYPASFHRFSTKKWKKNVRENFPQCPKKLIFEPKMVILAFLKSKIKIRPSDILPLREPKLHAKFQKILRAVSEKIRYAQTHGTDSIGTLGLRPGTNNSRGSTILTS